MNQRSNKRNQLILAAFELFQEHPYQSATLAMLAEKAAIPLGNIYYYFKSKDLLLDAVIDFFIEKMRSRLIECQKQSCSKARLKLFVQQYLADQATICQWGEPLFLLSRSLPDMQHKKVEELLDLVQKWCIQQFMHESNSAQKGTAFLQRLYGIVNIAALQRDPLHFQKNMKQFMDELELC